MVDLNIKKWLKWAILGAGRTARDVSLSLGYRPDDLTQRLASRDGLSKEFIHRILHELGYSMGDFFTCMEGRLGDPRIHLGRILATAEAPSLWLSKFPSAKRSKSPKRPPVDIWELSTKRFEISLKRTSSYAGWYACFGATEAERCEGWGVLGVAQQEKAAYRHAAYCYLQALELCEMESEPHALLLRRLANLLDECGEFEVYQECLSRALGLFAVHGNMECVGRVLVNLSAAYGQLGQFQASCQTARQAFKLTTDKRHLFVAHHGAGLSYLGLGNVSKALQMAEYCQNACESDREIFYAEYLHARCFIELEKWEKAIGSLQRASNVASYDGIFRGDQLELELMNVRCHLEMHNGHGANLGIERFRKVALLVSRKFANAYTSELRKLIRRRDVEAVLQLQSHLGEHLRQRRHPG